MPSMALDDERCCFCRHAVLVWEWADRPGWLEVECPVCGLYRVERQFWVAAHFKRARQPVRYRSLAWWLAEHRDRALPPEIPFEGWDTVVGPHPSGETPAMRQTVYQGYAIRTTSYSSGPGAWVPEARVTRDHGAERVEHEILDDATRRYPTATEADVHALALARRWIDSHG